LGFTFAFLRALNGMGSTEIGSGTRDELVPKVVDQRLTEVGPTGVEGDLGSGRER
jgi:hypothetical protein